MIPIRGIYNFDFSNLSSENEILKYLRKLVFFFYFQFQSEIFKGFIFMSYIDKQKQH